MKLFFQPGVQMLSGVLFVAGSLLSCSARQALDASPSAVAKTSKLWPEPGKIPVCWHTTQDEAGLYPELRQRVQELVQQQFDRTGSIRFVGWRDCDKGLEARLNACIGRFPKPPDCIGLERQAIISVLLTRKLPQGTFGVSSIGPEAKAPPTMLLDPARIESTAVHEFGHAIGLQHEHARTDSPRYVQDPARHGIADDVEVSDCPDYAQAGKVVANPEHNKYLTAFDPDSVMNYCSRKNVLSPRDIEGINQLYP